MQQANRKNLGIFIIIGGFLLLIVIVYFGFFRNKTTNTIQAPVTPLTNNQLPSGTDSGTSSLSEKPRADNINYDLSKQAPHKVNANDVAKIAMAFAERFGSYSNQSSYGNFTDLKIMMTQNMKDWADEYVKNLQASSTNQTAYYGITTTGVTSEIKKFDDNAGLAQIIITTQRQEIRGSSDSSTSFMQKLDLDFKKVNGEWLVDRGYWEK